MEFFKAKKMNESRKKAQVKGLFENIFQEQKISKKALEKEIILSLRPITSGEEKYLKIEEIRKSNPKMPIKGLLALYEGGKNNIDAFPSAKKIRRMTNVDALEKDLPILTRKMENDEKSLMKKLEEFSTDNMLPIHNKPKYTDPHGNISFKNIKNSLNREIVKTTFSANASPDMDFDYSVKATNSVKYLSGIDFVEEKGKNILDSVRSNLIERKQDILSGKNIISPRNPISTLGHYEPEFIKLYENLEKKKRMTKSNHYSSHHKSSAKYEDKNSLEKSIMNSSIHSGNSTKIVSKFYNTSTNNTISGECGDMLNSSKQQANTFNQQSFLKLEASQNKTMTNEKDAFSTFFSSNKKKLFPSLKESEREYLKGNMIKGLKSDRMKKRKFFEIEAQRTLKAGESVDLGVLLSKFEMNIEKKTRENQIKRNSIRNDEIDDYIHKFNKKYETNIEKAEMIEENSLLSILKMNKLKKGNVLPDLFPSLNTDLNLISLEQEKVQLDRLTLGLSMLNLHSKMHTNIDQLPKFKKAKGKYMGIYIDDEDPEEENKLIIGENSHLKKQFNTIRRREKAEMYFQVKNIDGYLKRAYNIVQKDE